MAFLSDSSKEFDSFAKEVEQVVLNIDGHTKKEDIDVLNKLIANFKMKTADFFRENRKLNIGVIGQVKAGKSSFLNALLFGGKEILPKASTPKTATLTKMEHSEKNIIQIEYYSKEEWAVIEENAKINLESEVYSSARELVEMVQKNGINPYPLLEKGKDIKEFAEYDELILGLNDYVGEDGKFTPVVKSVTLYLNKEEFKGISIVDTPGLNDPIASRTIRTKEFMEVCDVVFFLSPSGYFLDQNDWTLLSSQLPQKGVKKLVLVASQYDSAIRDLLKKPDADDVFEDDENSTDSIPVACKMVEKKLKKRAKLMTGKYIEELNLRHSSEALKEVIKQCENPIMVSSMAYNMTNKEPSEFTKEESALAYALKPYSKNLQSDLNVVGNFEDIKIIFNSVVEEKEKIFIEKAKSFVPNAKEELKNVLVKFLERTSKRKHILESNDQAQLLDKKEAVEKQMSAIKSDIATVFGDLNNTIETEKMRGIRELRELSQENLNIKERSGTTIHTDYNVVSDSSWWNPFSWGKSHKEYYTYEEHYQYCIAADAVEILNQYTLEASNVIETVFTNAIKLKEFRRVLLDVIMNNFDMGSEKFDVSYFRSIVEETVNSIEYPVFKIDIGDDVKNITTLFSGEITSAKEKTALISTLGRAVLSVNNKLIEEFDNKVQTFKKVMIANSHTVQDSLLNNISAEFKLLLEECENKNKEIDGYKEYEKILENELEKIK
jgi:hypothetical protein